MGDGSLVSFTLWFSLGDVEGVSQATELMCYSDLKVLLKNPGDFPRSIFFRDKKEVSRSQQQCRVFCGGLVSL